MSDKVFGAVSEHLQATSCEIDGFSLAALLAAGEMVLEEGDVLGVRSKEMGALRDAVRVARLTLGIGTKDDLMGGKT